MRPPASEARDGVQSNDVAVLIIATHGNEAKIRRHWGPLAAITRRTTMVSLTADQSVDGITYRQPPTMGNRYLGLVMLFVVALHEAATGDYDTVVSISLFPYGCFALVVGTVFGMPVHLGVIGSDIDRHGTAWYGLLPIILFRRFDAVSVPGTVHRSALLEWGVAADRIEILSNAIDIERYRPSGTADPEYDFIWVGRFSEEKDPLMFVRALRELRAAGTSFNAVMVGSGPLEEEVRGAIQRGGFSAAVDLPGWVDDPRTYYKRSAVFVLTSRREGLPLTLLEAMAMGVPPVVPRVGSVTDVAKHGQTAYIVEDRSPGAIADALVDLRTREDLRGRLAANATAVREEYSQANARADWDRILGTLLNGEGSSTTDVTHHRDTVIDD